MSYYFQHSFVRSQLLTLHHAAPAIRLPWHFPDDSREMLETKGSLNGFYPLQRVWWLLIDRLIPWRNWMHQGKRLMKQSQTWIPSTHYQTYPSVLQHGPASGSSLPPTPITCYYVAELKGQMNIWNVLFLKNIFLITLNLIWGRRIKKLGWWERQLQKTRRAGLTISHQNDNSFGAWLPDEIGSTMTAQQHK